MQTGCHSLNNRWTLTPEVRSALEEMSIISRMICVALLGLTIGCTPANEQGVAAYVGRDLTKLSKTEAVRFDQELRAITKDKPKEDAWQTPSPRWIKQYRTGRTQWLLFCLADPFGIPGTGVVRVYGFSRDWKLTFKSEFATGYRLAPEKVELRTLPEFTLPILAIKVRSQGPMMSVNGGPSKPAFHPENGIWQYYAFNDEGALLIRMTADAVLYINSYHGGFPSSGGPDMSKRSPKAWKADLHSSDPPRQLSAMMWLSAFHLNSKDWRKEGFARESVESSKCFETLRADPTVKARLKELEKGPNKWVREQAALTLKRLAEPLAPVEDPPNWG